MLFEFGEESFEGKVARGEGGVFSFFVVVGKTDMSEILFYLVEDVEEVLSSFAEASGVE